jgi:GNAT superfamily N-acetyltransferase
MDYMQHVIDMQANCNGQFLVAWWRDTIVAFIFGYTEEEDESRCEEPSGTIAYISDGYVMPSWRGKGLYRKLNQQLEQHFAQMGIKRFTRFTLWNNEPMKALLEREGYKLTRLLYEKWI